jgi:predicted Zn-dependent peptidase
MDKSDAAKPPSKGILKVEAMKFRPLNVKIPKVGREVERVQLPNGMILFLMEDHTLPQVSIQGIVRTGRAYEKREKFGVAELTGTVMRTGGTKDFTPAELNDRLAYMAAELETGIGDEDGSISLEVISSQIDPAFELFAQVLRYPAFNGKEIDLAKSHVREGLIRRNDDVYEIGQREFYSRVQPGYCNGWEYDWSVVKAVTREDLMAWHERFYHPNNMMFAVVGDFNRDEMIARFNKTFGGWQPSPVDFSGLQETEYAFNPGIFCAVKDVDQSYIRMGHPGIKRDNPDAYAIRVMNYILGGGGFQSYLMEKVRSDEGLAYSVGSYFNVDSRPYGTAGAYSSTRADATARAIELILATINRIRTQKVGQKRLDWARNSIINSFLFKFDSARTRTLRLMMLEYDGLPADYYEGYCRRIQAVTEEDVLRVAQKYLRPGDFTIVVVGDPARFDKPLSGLGKTEEIKLKDFTE